MSTRRKVMDSNEKEMNKTVEKKKESNFLIIIKKIFIIVTILIGISSSVLFIIYFFNSFNMEKIEFIGPLLNILSVSLGIALIMYAAIIISGIWILYGFIYCGYKTYIKLSKKNKKLFVTVLIAISLIIIIFFSFLLKYKKKNKNIAEVLNTLPSSEFYDTNSYYFIYNDKIYYYNLANNSNFSKMSDTFFVMNLDGTDNKKLAETDELRFAHFYFVYNNEAYYYTMYYDENKKIDLTTGKVTSLGNNDIYLSKTLKDGIVYSYYDKPELGMTPYVEFKKIDLNNNNILSKVKINYTISNFEYFLDYDGVNIYYLENFNSKQPSIYKNDECIFKFNNDKNFSKIEFIAVDKEYIYFEQNEHIYKLNADKKVIEKEINYNIDGFTRISSGNNGDNYYYSNNNIYSFNLSNMNFDLVLDNVPKKPEYVYNIRNQLIFTENTNNLKYNSEIDNLGSVIIYNKETKEVENINNIRKFSYDENKLYLLIQHGNDYKVDIH